MLTFILKLAGIIGASAVAYSLATTKKESGPFEETHPYMAIILEIGALAIIFLN